MRHHDARCIRLGVWVISCNAGVFQCFCVVRGQHDLATTQIFLPALTHTNCSLQFVGLFVQRRDFANEGVFASVCLAFNVDGDNVACAEFFKPFAVFIERQGEAINVRLWVEDGDGCALSVELPPSINWNGAALR